MSRQSDLRLIIGATGFALFILAMAFHVWLVAVAGLLMLVLANIG